MGKAEILNSLGDGQYSIKVIVDHTETNQKIKIYQRAIDSVNKIIADEQAKEDPNQLLIKLHEVRKLNLTKELLRYSALFDEEIVLTAWCVDYTVNLSGIVGTIEPGTELKNGINIQFGYNDNYIYNERRDGILKPFICLDLYQSMLNYMLMPAIQKRKPTYRYGTITSIDKANDICNVNIDETKSTLQNIDVNFFNSYEAVPIEYMDCNSQAFENGDRVIIKFDHFDRYNPKIIGFVSNPKPCGYWIKINTINGFTPTKSGYRVRITQPIQSTNYNSIKGYYSEDFTIIAEKDVDSLFMVNFQKEDFINQINRDYAINICITQSAWFFYTHDWRGNEPTHGIKMRQNNYGYDIIYRPLSVGEQSDYMGLYDQVRYFNTGIDLREFSTTEIQNLNGETVNGYAIDAIGIPAVKGELIDYIYHNVPCWRDYIGQNTQAVYGMALPNDFSGTGIKSINTVSAPLSLVPPNYERHPCIVGDVCGYRDFTCLAMRWYTGIKREFSPNNNISSDYIISVDRNGSHPNFENSTFSVDMEENFSCMMVTINTPGVETCVNNWLCDTGSCEWMVWEEGMSATYTLVNMPQEMI